MFRPQSFQCLEAATGRHRQGHRLEALRDRRRRQHAADRRHAHRLLRRAQPADRAARHVARRADQALARGGARVQRVRHRELHRPDGGRREHGPDRSSASSAWAPRPRHASASRPWRRCATGRRRVRTAARSASRSRERSGSLGAGVVEISLDRQTGKIKVHKVWVAVDGGTIVSPGAGRGQRRERDPLRALERAARARHAEGRRRGAVELPRLQPDAHVGHAGGDARPVRRRRHAADRASARSATRSSPARSPTPSTA